MSQPDRTQSPDPPTRLRRRCEQNARRVATRLEPDRPPHPAAGGAERAPGPDRRCRVREPEHVRRSDPDAELHAYRREQGLRYNRFHVTALCSPTRAALLTGTEQPRGRLRLDRRVRGRIPRLLGHPAARLRAAAEDPPGQRLLHGGVREVAPDPRWAARSRPDRSTAGRTAGGSTTSTGSSAAVRANGTRAWPRTRRSSARRRSSTTRTIRTTSLTR